MLGQILDQYSKNSTDENIEKTPPKGDKGGACAAGSYFPTVVKDGWPQQDQDTSTRPLPATPRSQKPPSDRYPGVRLDRPSASH